MPIVYAGDGTLNYRFYASDGVDFATGPPTGNKTITLTNNAPALDWIGTGGYIGDGADPDSEFSGSSFQFQIKYTDTDNNPPTIIQLWIDRNNDGDYLDGDEKIDMAEFNTFDTDITDGKLYFSVLALTNAGDNIFNYRFHASDGSLATGIPTFTDKTVTVINNAP